MYKIQQFIILIGITLIFLMGLYLPWVYIDSNKVEHPMGYSLVWKPPINQQQVKAQMFGITLQLDTETQTANTIDLFLFAYADGNSFGSDKRRSCIVQETISLI